MIAATIALPLSIVTFAFAAWCGEWQTMLLSYLLAIATYVLAPR